MSNERIDLTQFEGHTKGNWCIDDGNLMIKTDELWIRLSEAYCDDGTTEDEDAINKKLMVAGPDLIAELKRCYERIDYLESVAEEYRQERPEAYCANCYAYLSEYDGDGVKECLCSDCEASE